LKLPQKNLGKTLEDIANYFVNRYPVAQDISARIDKWYCIKLKGFFISKETISRIKSQPQNRRKYLQAIHWIKD
jgi:hypothetical protein